MHGGKIKGSSDTISVLNKTNTVNGFEIKEQLLAAILRFADELADDATRADYDALDNGIIGPASSYSIPGDSCYLFSFEFPIKAKDCLEEVHDENNQSII